MSKKGIVALVLSSVLLVAAIGAVIFFSVRGVRNDPLPTTTASTEEVVTETATSITNGKAVTSKNSKISAFPYTLPDADLQIISVTSYSGAYLEDGTDKAVKNIMSVTLKNTSDKTVNYALITIGANEKNFEFEFTTLPPGKTVQVLEKNKAQFFKAKEYKYVSLKGNLRNGLTIDKNLKVSAIDNKITVENLTDNEIKTAYVYYKNVGVTTDYIGGITYRTKFSDIGPGLKQTQETLHYSKITSKILMAEIIE